ncbi:S1C family serine protease [Pectinatus cerevisiiphilus]|uniref:Serine protease Do n=1 Tax=Pectinatus cerevisiiphilus TaxID=86956 RepID=A0A4R3KB19_9FIRM|nr:trypsin-like peptidase domain-containing protein [Pectinatus cerevisiiphilus]TCS80130.1 serine protease Do [Pectinatus cerevisiiphilus]
MKKFLKYKLCFPRFVIFLAGISVVAIFLASGCSTAGPANNTPSSSSSTALAAKTPSEPVSDARNTPIVRAAKAVGPAIVGITNKAVARDWFNNQVEVNQGVGSGVIFKSDGYIVTNNHVIDGAKEITVSLADGRSLPGKLVGSDPVTDIAVVKIDATDLPVAKFGNSDDIMVGEPAIAIGNPMGLEFQGSVTAGVISALNRTLDIGEGRVKLLQTDAAINPGNSGGALVNADGLVIGINSAKLAANGVEGMGFAIPINTVQPIIDQLIANGRVSRPYLGVGIFDKDTAAKNGYLLNIDKGVYVAQVAENGSAAAAGIQRGDIIVKIDDKDINNVNDLRDAISAHKINDKVSLVIIRNGESITVSAVLQEMPSQSQ